MRILYYTLFDNMSTFLCVFVGVVEGAVTGGVREGDGWLAGWLQCFGQHWSVLPTRPIDQCFRFPSSFSLHRAPPSSTREARVGKVSPKVPAFPQSALLPAFTIIVNCLVLVYLGFIIRFLGIF